MTVVKAKQDKLESFTGMKLLYFKGSLFNCSCVLSILVILGRRMLLIGEAWMEDGFLCKSKPL